MDIPLLPDIVAIFCLSIGVLLVCHQVKIPPIVGFLLTGVLCGPTALGLVQNPHAVELLAEIGVVLLLFSIGLEMSGEELMLCCHVWPVSTPRHMNAPTVSKIGRAHV